MSKVDRLPENIFFQEIGSMRRELDDLKRGFTISGGGTVSSVFGRTGTVVATSGDYTTDQVTEGANLYFTNTRFDTRFAASSLASLGTRTHSLLSGLSADDHTQYHTDARALTWLGTRSTSDLLEGTNLYYTAARVNALLAASPTITTPTLTVNDTGFTIQDDADPTKKATFQASSITASTTRVYTLPNFTGTFYITGGTDVSVADGGTGRSTSTTAYGLIAAGTTATGAHQTISPGTSGQILKSNGASALASFQTGAPADVGLGNVPNIDATARANHTGTQPAATISDFNTAADARITNAAGSTIASLVAGKVPTSQLPAVSLVTVQTAASQAAQLALTTQEGDVVVRTDLNQTYMRNAGTTGTMTDFTLLNTPTDAVTSVNGFTGAVVLSKTDIGLGSVPNVDATARANHTGTQLASTISDFSGAADARITAATGVSVEPFITAGTSAQYWRGDKTWQTLNKAAVGLTNADDTSDVNKPVSTAQAAADALRVLKAGDTMTGNLALTGTTTSLTVRTTNTDTDASAVIRDNGGFGGLAMKSSSGPRVFFDTGTDGTETQRAFFGLQATNNAFVLRQFGDSGTASNLMFAVQSGGARASTTGMTEIMTLLHGGMLGLGSTAPVGRLQIGSATTVNSINGIVFGKAETASQGSLPVIQMKSIATAGTTVDLAIAARSTGGGIYFYTGADSGAAAAVSVGTGSNAARMSISATGLVSIPGSLKLGTSSVIGQAWLATDANGNGAWGTLSGGGNMNTSTYDTDANGIIDVAAGGVPQSAWTAFTPTWTAVTTNPTIGNGTLAGRYIQIGKYVIAQYNVLWGTTTTNGVGIYSFSLPVTGSSSAVASTPGGTALVNDTGVNTYQGVARVETTTTCRVLVFKTTATYLDQGDFVAPTVPFTPGSTDWLRFTIIYEAA